MPEPLTIVITGATSGIGRLAALALAAQGHRLVLLARDSARADALVRSIDELGRGVPAKVFLADLRDTGSVHAAGTAIAARFPVVDVLINNAGIHAFAQRATSEGYPEMVAVNYFAPWLLTRALLPSLAAAPAARVVTVASEASRRHGRLSLPSDLTALTPFTARGSSSEYGKSKLLDIMFTRELARRLRASSPTSTPTPTPDAGTAHPPTTGICATCLDPGFNVTGLGRELAFAAPLERVLRALRIGDPNRGASLIVRLATDPQLNGRTGEYYTVRRREPLTPVAPATDAARCAELWEATAKLLGPWPQLDGAVGSA
ncbi:SDR family NAD(P)-dependent oxidoreductase [Pyxidicoccus parkwayensis]|uniref:SDR family NAD(P)-dependent oxidoreductase n=1 Tax=Pyxidicoccus parkwayensis TaxID=2813578 RepID=A0ABX7NK65_9BACT|nr:SDR family NAD(P)-dependent oxidoreductase [Pyxidicoccus parkwaysis]QSQ19175.1 SDR family NAD(P)-dependent oxidoreductase [Pyxidicoccus parkwaysis]